MILTNKINNDIIFVENNKIIQTIDKRIFEIETNKKNILNFIRNDNNNPLIIEYDENIVKFEINEINYNCSLRIIICVKNEIKTTLNNVSIDSFLRTMHL